MPVPQIGLKPISLSAEEEQRLLAIAHPEEATDLFATDPNPAIQRLGRLALRRTPPHAADYFTLGDLCAQRALEGERLVILYVAKALNAYKRAVRLAKTPADQALATLAQANFAAWAVNSAHSTPSAHNIAVALWAVAEMPIDRLSDDTRAAALELTNWYAAALRAAVPPGPQTLAEDVPRWLESPAEGLINDPASDNSGTEDDSTTQVDTSDASASHSSLTAAPRSEDKISDLPAFIPERSTNGEDFQNGELIGERYRVRNILSGGMGIIYVCLDEQTETLVALKTFQARYLSDETAKQRFENEARLWVEMDKHPNIVRAHKVDSFGKSRLRERPHIILEYVGGAEDLGSDLRGWIKHKRLTTQLSLEIALGICSGMLHAVSKKEGFVHRDLKPANILVRHDAAAKVTDFGLGRALDSSTESQEMPRLTPEMLKQVADARLTQPGKVMGTLLYMAPEQYTPRLQPLDARADIFAFGVILYEMLTGIRLFSGAAGIPTLREMHKRPIHFPPQLRDQLPADLCDVVLRCLRLDREARPQTWQALRTELAACYEALVGTPPQLESNPAALQREELMDKAYSLTELKRPADALPIYDQALALDPNSAWIWARKARVLRLLKRYPEALAAFDRALQIQPGFAWAWYNKGIVLERLGQHEAAQAAYSRATFLNPRDIWADHNHARLLLSLGQAQEALAHIQAVLAIDPDHALSHVLHGRILLRLHQPKAALAAFDRAIQLDNELGEALLGRGEALNALKRSTDAISTFLRASRLLPSDVSAWLRLADAYLTSGNLPEALSALEQAKRLRPDYKGVWLRLGRAFFHHQRYDEALHAYGQILAKQPNHLAALEGKSLVLLAQNRHTEAISALQAVLAARPDDPNVILRLGNTYLKCGDAENALATFERVLSKQDDLAWAWAKRAIALCALQRTEDAISSWRRALALNPAQAWYRTQLAELLAKAGQADEALSLLETSETAEAFALRAAILRRLKRFDEALHAYGQALALNPKYAWAHNGRGILSERLSSIHADASLLDEALAAYEQAVEHAPHVVWYRLNLLSLLLRLGKPVEALHICEEGLAAAIGDPRRIARLWVQKGAVLRRLYRYTEALEAYAQARTLAPDLPSAWAGEGLAFAALGKHAEALGALKRATDLHPENAWFWYNYGEMLIESGNYSEAIRALNRVLVLKPKHAKAELKRKEARRKLSQ